MTFDVPADAYDRFMGRYSKRLAPDFADFADPSGTALDVGCGPGALTAELVARLGADRVVAADPSEPFVAAARARFPEVSVHLAPAESLPFEDGAFDAVIAQLVVHFMSDPVGGVREMARVTRADGVVAACVWDMGHSPLTPFWRAARDLNPAVEGEAQRPGTREGQLEEIFRAAGLHDISATALAVHVEHEAFDDWWEPFTLGVGPVGAYYTKLEDDDRVALRRRCNELLGNGPFSIPSRVWAARGTAA
jgi:ubiquinone/menaquinone biosynthesis C-methylase UbiE